MQTDRQPSFCLVERTMDTCRVYRTAQWGSCPSGRSMGRRIRSGGYLGICHQQTLPILRLLLAIMYRTFDIADLTEPEMQEEWGGTF